MGNAIAAFFATPAAASGVESAGGSCGEGPASDRGFAAVMRAVPASYTALGRQLAPRIGALAAAERTFLPRFWGIGAFLAIPRLVLRGSAFVLCLIGNPRLSKSRE